MSENSTDSPGSAPVMPSEVAPPPVAVAADAAGRLSLWDRSVRSLIYATAFLVPLFFAPWTLEPLEFSKQMLLFVLTTGALVVWLLKLLVQRHFQFVKTALDLPISVFLIVYLLASIFSVDRVSSFLGAYGTFSGNFFQILFLVIFYYLVVNNFETLKQLVTLFAAFYASVLVVLLYTVLQFAGWHIFRFPFATTTSFNTVGGLLMISLFAAFAVVLSLGFSSGSSRGWFRFPAGRAFQIAGLALSFLILLTINFLYAWLALLTGLLIYMIFQLVFSPSFSMRNYLMPLALLVLVISVLVIQLVFPAFNIRGIFNFQLPVEVRLDYATANPVLKGVVLERPILGTGPGTFIYAFSKHRDQSFNLSDFWNVRFDKAPSEAAEVLVSSGALGFLVFEILSAIFIVYAGFFLYRNKDDYSWNTSLGLFAGFAVLWIAHWFFFFNTVMAMSFWLVIAVFMGISRNVSGEQSKTLSYSMIDSPRQAVSIVSAVSLGMVVVIVFTFFAFSVYAADISYRRGLIASNHTETFDSAQASLERAIRLNRFRPDYYLTYSEYLLYKINRELATDSPNVVQIQSWLASSINTARASLNLSSNNSAAWERLANLYSFARPLVAGVDKFIIESLQQATEKDTKNPVLYTELGQAYRLTARSIDPAILGRGVDSDSDGLSDEQEQALGSNLDNRDTNGNNVLDGNEVLAGLNPGSTGALPDAFLAKYIKINQDSLIKAEEAFRQAIVLKEDYATAYYQLVLTIEQSGNAAKAIEELEKTLQKFPANLTFKFELGRMYFNVNRVDEAARQFQDILVVVPNHANSRFSLALSYERLGKLQRALEEYRKVAELSPGNESINAKIREIEGTLSARGSR